MKLMVTPFRKTLAIFCLLGTFLCCAPWQPDALKAEGTAQVMPTALNGTALLMQPGTSSGPLLAAASENRVKFNINNHTIEDLYFGFNLWTRIAPIGPVANGYFKIFDPTGALVAGPTVIPTVGAGFIPNYAQGVAGPNVSGLNPTGYAPLIFNPTMNGDYYIEIYRSATAGATMIAGNGGEMFSVYFDFTVSETNFTLHPGRVHCQKWSFITYDPASPTFIPSLNFSFEGDYFALTQDSSVVKVDFPNGFRPLGYVLAMNFYGVNNTSNFPVDRISVYTGTVTPTFLNGFKVFLSDPDPIAFIRSSAAAAPAITNQVFGCPGNYFIPFYIDKPGDVAILLDLNGVLGYQASTADVVIEQYGIAAGNHVVTWNGLDGLGAVVSGVLPIDITVTIFRGRTNIPIFDAEMNQNGFSVSGISPVPGPRKLFWQDNTLAIFGVCPVGATGAQQASNNTTGAGVSMTNSLLGILGPAHAWDGGATFAVPAPIAGMGSATVEACDDFGNARTINTWFWANEVASTPVSRFLPDCDIDNDGVVDGTDIDDDNDGIPDIVESGGIDPNADADSDGIPNFLDPSFPGFVDLDHDGVNDNFDHDQDGIIDAYDVDSDNDGIADGVEANGGTVPPGFNNGTGTFTGPVGGNGMPDNSETVPGSGISILPSPDTDGDGLRDYVDIDTDNDGIQDIYESQTGGGPYVPPMGVDANSNGRDDAYDGGGAITPTDFDGDGHPDYRDLDTDNDGIPDITESGNGGFDTNNDGEIDSSTDLDRDGLMDVADGTNGTGVSGFVPGGAGDVNDPANINNPANDVDADNDGLPNWADLDADNDGIPDITESGNGNLDVNNDGEIDSPTDVDGDGLQDVADGVNNNGAGGFTPGGAGDVIDNDNPNNPANDINADNDGLPNYLDVDSDNDGIADITESGNGNFDVDNNGTIDSATDVDNDGLQDVADGVNNTGAGGFTAGGVGDVIDNDNPNNPANDINGDTDGLPNYLDVDSDNDGIADITETGNGNFDVDNNGTIDSATDVDGDGLQDVVDGVNNNGAGGFTAGGAGDVIDNDNPNNGSNDINLDNDGLPNYLDVDADNDGIADITETGNGNLDVDNNGSIDSATDVDGDGLSDVADGVNNNGAGGFTAGGAGDVIDNDNANNPANDINADADNFPNYLDLDADNDGIADIAESGNGNFDVDNNGTIDSATDVDGDGLMDVTDGVNNNGAGGFTAGGPGDVIDNDNLNNPTNDINADNDGLPNYLDIDSDNDGIADLTETRNGNLDVNNDGVIDSAIDVDGDGLSDVADGVNNSGAGGFTPGLSVDVIDNDNLNNGSNDIDFDNDAFANYLDLDADNDGIPDVTETLNGASDVNNDGVIDSAIDVDGDGLMDFADGVNNNGAGGFTPGGAGDVIDNDNFNNAANDINADGDVLPNFLDLDADNDGITDVIESGNIALDALNDGMIDAVADVDADGLRDIVDGVNNNGAGGFSSGAPTDVIDNDNFNNPLNDINADADVLPNFLDIDSDDDGLTDVVEAVNGVLIPDLGGGGVLDGRIGNVGILDLNNDGWDDNANLVLPQDVDVDGLFNFIDIDADNDGIADYVEGVCTGCINSLGGLPSGADANGNGLIDSYENINNANSGPGANFGINPYNHEATGNPDFLDPDTDDDGYPDWNEGFDLNCSADSWDDILAKANSYETANGNPGNYPLLPDTDSDGLPDWLDNVGTPGGATTIPMPFITFGNAAYLDANRNGLVDIYDPLMNGSLAPTPNCDALADDDWRDLNTTVNFPIFFLSNRAEKVGEVARVFWSVTEAENVAHFEIERQLPTETNFSWMATVAANPNGQVTAAYQTDDVAPAMGINLYRIKVVSLNGEVLYSSTMSVLFANGSTVLVSPNPIGEGQVLNLNYSLQRDDMIRQVQLYDMQGRIVMNQQVELQDQGQFVIDLSAVSTGQFMVIVHGNNVHQVFRITKQ